MAIIRVTQSGTTVAVKNGDKVVVDIPGGGDVTIVAANASARRFTVEFVDDTHSDNVTVDLATFSAPNLHMDIRDYDPSDSVNLSGAFNQNVDPNNVDEFNFDYIGADGQTHSGFVRAKDVGERDFTTDPAPIIICFGRGTQIETIDGPKAIETLKPGDLVLTYDTSISAVKWIGSSTVSAYDLATWQSLRPIRVARDAFGKGRPAKETLLSPNHRVLLHGWRAELLFGEAEVIVPIKALVDGKTVTLADDVAEVEYFHLLLEQHEIVFANGMLSESLFLGDQALLALSDDAKTDLRQTLTRSEWHDLSLAATVRPCITASMARLAAA